MSRYEVPRSEGGYEPGSGGLVLCNRLGIRDPAVMDDAELLLLERLYRSVLSVEFPDRRLRVADLKHWHHRWLGNLYGWAGHERSVNMAKGSFHFAAAAQLPRLLDEFQRECLNRFTPTHGFQDEVLVEALAVTHVELILIHPFREGNGRLARLLADVMAVQAGAGLLDYSSWDAAREQYFAAIRKGLDKDYSDMMRFMEDALQAGSG